MSDQEADMTDKSERNSNLFDKFFWIPVVITTLLCFGFTLTNYSIGIDDPTLFWYIDWKIFLQQGRWGYEWISMAYKERPEESREKVFEQVRQNFPHASQEEILKVLG